jgi:hypothetical protein
VGRGFLYEASRSHADTPNSVGLLWMSDQPVAETFTWQHTALTRGRHPCLRRDSNPKFQQANGRRPTFQTARPSGSENTLLVVWNTLRRTLLNASDFGSYHNWEYTGHTQKNGAVLILFTIKTAPFVCVCPVHFFPQPRQAPFPVSTAQYTTTNLLFFPYFKSLFLSLRFI